MGKYKTRLDGVEVWFIETEMTRSSLRIRREMSDGGDQMCVLTHRQLREEAVYLVFCNHRFFPNCFACKFMVDELGFDEAARRIRDDYAAAQEAMKKFRHWL
jgi:hypothetical protein